jgi:hypothetical protein
MNHSVNHREHAGLVDALDKVLEKGAIINGDLVLRVADVDLVYLGLRLILTSVSKAEELSGKNFGNPDRGLTLEDMAYIEKLQREIKRAEENIPKLIRKLMEKEAFRRVKRGTLSPVEIQKLGLSLKAVKKKIQEIQTIFGLEDEELDLDLGPLGNLMS